MCISLCVRRERVIAIVLLRVIGSCSVLCDTVFNRLQQLRDRFLGLTELNKLHSPHARTGPIRLYTHHWNLQCPTFIMVP